MAKENKNQKAKEKENSKEQSKKSEGYTIKIERQKQVKRKPETVMAKLRKELKGKQLTIGYATTMKAIAKDEINEVLISKDCPERMAKELEEIASKASIAVQKLNIDKEQLGNVLKKPFHIAVLGIKKK